MIAKDLARADLWSLAIDVFFRSPWGNGPDTFENIYRRYRTSEMVSHTAGTRVIQATAHNEVLQILCTLGVFGALAFAFLIREARPKDMPTRSAFIALMLVTMTNATGIEVYCLGAFLLGTISRKNVERIEPSGWLAVLSLFVSCVFLLCELMPGIAHRINPCEPGYLAQAILHHSPNPLAAAYSTSACRPRDALSQQVVGEVFDYGLAQGKDTHRLALEHITLAHELNPLDEEIINLKQKLDQLENVR